MIEKRNERLLRHAPLGGPKRPLEDRVMDLPLTLDRLVDPNRAANPQEKELPIKAPPPLPPNREEAQRQASAGAASQVSQSGLLSEGTQGYLQEGWLSSALGAYIDRQNARPGVREHFMEIGRLFAG